MSQQEVYDRFLKKFTEELLTTIKLEKVQKESVRIEEARVDKAIESEKLKQKFSEYLTSKPQVKPVNQNQQQNKTQIQPPGLQAGKSASNELAKINQTTNVIKKPSQEYKIDLNAIPKAEVKSDEIDFGRLNVLVQDPLVTYLDCPGENRDVTVRKEGRVLRVTQTLKQLEIENIIKNFSEKARIPLIEGMLRARYNNLEIVAVFSKSGSSFVLKKQAQIIDHQNPYPTIPRQIPNPAVRINPSRIQQNQPNIQKPQGFMDKKITLPF